MSTKRASIVSGLVLLAACGGGGTRSNPAPSQNIYTGTVAVSSALPAGTTTCQGTPALVKFQAGAAGVDLHTVTVVGGGCVTFQNDDSVQHQPGPRGVGCTALNAPAPLNTGQSFTTGPLGSAAGASTCDWQDTLNPPGSGGGAGGGY